MWRGKKVYVSDLISSLYDKFICILNKMHLLYKINNLFYGLSVITS